MLNMLLTEYNYDTDIAVQRQEAYESGSQQAKIETAKNLLTMSLSIENIAKATGLSVEDINALTK